MPSYKIIAIALVAALANPLCCCLAFVTADDHLETPAASAADHACCFGDKASSSDAKADGQAHDPADCPHSYERESQISQAADTIELNVKTTLLPYALASCLDLEDLSPAMRSSVTSHKETTLHLAATPTQLAYCVYLL